MGKLKKDTFATGVHTLIKETSRFTAYYPPMDAYTPDEDTRTEMGLAKGDKPFVQEQAALIDLAYSKENIVEMAYLIDEMLGLVADTPLEFGKTFNIGFPFAFGGLDGFNYNVYTNSETGKLLLLFEANKVTPFKNILLPESVKYMGEDLGLLESLEKSWSEHVNIIVTDFNLLQQMKLRKLFTA